MTVLRPRQELVVAAPEVKVVDGSGDLPPRLECEVKIRQSGRELPLWFRFWNLKLVEPILGAEASLALSLLPAMKLGSPLRIEGEVDRRVLAGAERTQEIFHTWYPEFSRIPVEAEAVVDRSGVADDRREVGVYFTGGLDSTYTVLKNKSEITHGVYVHGYDIPLDNTAFRERVSASLREAADAYGIALIEGESNAKDIEAETGMHWGYHYHGSCFAAIAMMLSGSMRKMFIASSGCYDRLVPWGSSYTLDPLWNTPCMELDHDGSEYDRLGKIRAVAQDELALRHLRVCFLNPEQGFNCGRCEKCLRTMVGLRLCGALDKCTVFNDPLDLKWLCESEEMRKQVAIHTIWGDYKEVAEQQGDDPELIEALTEVLSWHKHRDIVRQVSRTKNELMASEHWRDSLPKFRGRLWESLCENDRDWLAGKMMKSLPETREEVFEWMWKTHRRWLRRRYRSASWTRFLERIGVRKDKSV